jgi:hypothetical protein
MQRFAVAIGLLFALTPALPVAADAQIIGVNITIAPPELPVYDQPPLPAPGYIWSPRPEPHCRRTRGQPARIR